MPTPLHVHAELVAYISGRNSAIYVLEQIFASFLSGYSYTGNFEIAYYPGLAESMYKVFPDNYTVGQLLELDERTKNAATLAAVATRLGRKELRLSYGLKPDLETDTSPPVWSNFPENCFTTEYLLSELHSANGAQWDYPVHLSRRSLINSLSLLSPKWAVDAALAYVSAWYIYLGELLEGRQSATCDQTEATKIMNEVLAECEQADGTLIKTDQPETLETTISEIFEIQQRLRAISQRMSAQ